MLSAGLLPESFSSRSINMQKQGTHTYCMVRKAEKAKASLCALNEDVLVTYRLVCTRDSLCNEWGATSRYIPYMRTFLFEGGPRPEIRSIDFGTSITSASPSVQKAFVKLPSS